MRHSESHPGLQNHSVGEIYPWTIRGVGDSLQGFHCVSGEQGPRFYWYSDPIGPQLDFSTAYRFAELWVEDQRIGLDIIDAGRLADAIADAE